MARQEARQGCGGDLKRSAEPRVGEVEQSSTMICIQRSRRDIVLPPASIHDNREGPWDPGVPEMTKAMVTAAMFHLSLCHIMLPSHPASLPGLVSETPSSSASCVQIFVLESVSRATSPKTPAIKGPWEGPWASVFLATCRSDKAVRTEAVDSA